MAHIKNPLSGLPVTFETLDPDGKPGYLVMPLELTPFRARILHVIRDGLRVIMPLTCVFVALDSQNINNEGLVWLAAQGLVAYCAFYGLFALTLRRMTMIEMTTTTISVRRWWGWRRYDRNLEHQFYLQIHDKAAEEQRRHAFEIQQASAQGSLKQKKAFYGASFHVILSYGGHRRDLLTVYGEKQAAEILARLQFCDRRLNEATGMGGGMPQKPVDEWNDTPGGLNHG